MRDNKKSKLCFVHDTVILESDDKFFDINLNYHLWEDRYLTVFDSVVVSTRCDKVTSGVVADRKGYTRVDGPGVEVSPIYAYRKITDMFTKRGEIKKALRQSIDKADKVIVRLPSVLGNIACDTCREQKKDYALEVVACPWDGYNHYDHWAGHLVAIYMWAKTRKLCRQARRVLYVTKDFLQNRYPTDGVTTNVSNVVLEEPKETVLGGRLEKISNMDSNKTVTLGLVGTLELESKGHMVALKALKKIKEVYPNVKLHFLGNGEGEKLKEFIGDNGLTDNVVFDGTKPSGGPVLEWMDSLDVILLPSFQEGLPRALIEAMSRGCPAVGAKTGGIPELISQGYLHKAGNYDKLAEDVLKLVGSKDEMREQAKKNFEKSKGYAKSVLDERRARFWRDFRDGK